MKRVFIATCGTTPYNPKVNGQTKQYNGIKTAELVLKTIELPIKDWEIVLPDAPNSSDHSLIQ